MAALFVLVLAAVVMRYAVASPFRFTEELAGLLLSLAVFLALPHTLASGDGIRVTLVSDRLRGRARRAAWIAGQAVLVAFCAVLGWKVWLVAEFTLELDLRSEVSRLPLGPFLLVTVASVALAGLVGLWQALRPPPG